MTNCGGSDELYLSGMGDSTVQQEWQSGEDHTRLTYWAEQTLQNNNTDSLWIMTRGLLTKYNRP